MVQMTDNTQAILDEAFGGAEERQRLAALWKTLPENQPLPDTPAVREALFEMVIGMHGEALKELERN